MPNTYVLMMLSIAFTFFYVTFFHEFINEKLHLFNSHKVVSRPRPRTFKTKTKTLGVKTETKTKTLGLNTMTKTLKIGFETSLDQDSSLENSKSAFVLPLMFLSMLLFIFLPPNLRGRLADCYQLRHMSPSPKTWQPKHVNQNLDATLRLSPECSKISAILKQRCKLQSLPLLHIPT